MPFFAMKKKSAMTSRHTKNIFLVPAKNSLAFVFFFIKVDNTTANIAFLRQWLSKCAFQCAFYACFTLAPTAVTVKGAG